MFHSSDLHPRPPLSSPAMSTPAKPVLQCPVMHCPPLLLSPFVYSHAISASPSRSVFLHRTLYTRRTLKPERPQKGRISRPGARGNARTNDKARLMSLPVACKAIRWRQLHRGIHAFDADAKRLL